MSNTKDNLRKKLLEIRKEISKNTEEYNLAAENIKSILINQDFYKVSFNIAAFIPFKTEINILLFIKQSIKDNKNIFVPIVDNNSENKKLFFARYNNKFKLLDKNYNIEINKKNIDLESLPKLDLMLIPTVGFDKFGNRLGMGKGYYDHTLFLLKKLYKDKNWKMPLILGVAFAKQEVENIPYDSLDYKLDGVITENELLVNEVRTKYF